MVKLEVAVSCNLNQYLFIEWKVQTKNVRFRPTATHNQNIFDHLIIQTRCDQNDFGFEPNNTGNIKRRYYQILS